MTFSRFLKYSSITGLAGYSTFILHQKDWDVGNIGLVRFGRAAWAVGQIAVDYKFSVSKLKDDSQRTLDLWSECHQRSAKRLLKLCSANGGVFIKVGQHIAALDYLVPKEYIEILKVLHNQAPQSSFNDIKKVIENELEENIEDVFAEFDEDPIGSASLAQVYRAKLKENNELVAVKVQHPEVFRHSLIDIATMEILFSIVSRIFPDFSFQWLAQETKKNLPKELDFLNEGKNSELVSILLKEFDWLKIPKVYWKYTTKRTLVMELVEGHLINDKNYFQTERLDSQQIASRLEDIYSQMIFIHGNIHCDPHPGNILVRKTGKKTFEMFLLDHGLYSMITDEFRRNYCLMWLAVLRGDIKEIKRCAKTMGIQESDGPLLSCMISAKPWSSIERGLENRPMDRETAQKEKKELRDNVSIYMNSISKILARVDRQLLLLMKTNDLIRSISHSLGCDERRSFLVMTRCCIDTVTKEQLANTKNILQRLVIRCRTQWLFFKIRMYSFYIWIDNCLSPKQIS